MLTVFHGDDIVSSRKALSDLKEQNQDKEIISLETKNISLTDLVQAVSSNSLFGGDKLVILENLSSLNLRSKLASNILDFILKGDFDNDVCIWDAKTLSPSIAKKFKNQKARVKAFKHPAVIFSLLESLNMAGTSEMLSNLNETLKSVEPEIILFMLVRHLRILIALKENAAISETKRLIPWQMGKLKRQAESLKIEDLLQTYQKLMIIDYQVKTSKTSVDLTKRLQWFIMNL